MGATLLLILLTISSPLSQVQASPLPVNGDFESGTLDPWALSVGLNQGGEVHVETHQRALGDPGSGSYVLHTRIGGQSNGHTNPVDLAQDISSAGISADMQISLSFYNKNNVNPCGSVSPPMADCWRIVIAFINYQRADQSTGQVGWSRYWYCDGTQCPEWVSMAFGLEGTSTFDVDEAIPPADRNSGTKLTQIVLQHSYKTFQTRGGSSTEKLEVFWDDIHLTAVSPIRDVKIDIKPGSFPNSINPESRGKIPVAILSSPGFDATSQVNPSTLTFGRTGNEQSLAFCQGSRDDDDDEQFEDVNGDGLPDLVCHFLTRMAVFQAGDTEGILRGQLLDGSLIEGTDSVRIITNTR